MTNLRQIPEPDYEYDVKAFEAILAGTVAEIQSELQTVDIASLDRKTQQTVLAKVAASLKRAVTEAFGWIKRVMPKSAEAGVARSLLSLGIAKSPEEARRRAKLNRMNQDALFVAMADTQADVLAVTRNIDRRVRTAIRKAAADAMRSNMARGINGARSVSADLAARIRKELGDAADNAIIDRAGRRWRVDTYANMLARTKLMDVYHEATMNEAVARGAHYAVISRHGAKDACRYHEGKIIRLTAEAPGNYPTYAELRGTGQIWHPNCKHTFSPVRNPERIEAQPVEQPKYKPGFDRHLIERDYEVPRKRGIGGAHNEVEFMKNAAETKILSAKPHPNIPGIKHIQYQLSELDKAGVPTGKWRARVFDKTVYDPIVISDNDMIAWGKEAAEEAKRTKRFGERMWEGFANNGLQFVGYVDKDGRITNFFPVIK